MSHSNGIISAPISASDPYQVLGVGMYGGGYDIGYICSNKHGKINKWAKYKPVNWDGQVYVNDSNWHRGKNGLCGFNIINGSAANHELMIQDLLLRGEDWEYVPDSKAFRLVEFEGYNHNAIKPFVSRQTDQIFNVSNPIDNTVIYVDAWGWGIGEDVENNFSITDLVIEGTSVENWYAGIVIIDENGNYKCAITSSNNIGFEKYYGVNSSVKPALTLIGEGEYKKIPMISSVDLSGVNAKYSKRGDTWNNGNIAFLPIKSGKLSIVKSADISIHYKVYTTDRGVVIQLIGTNNTNIAVTVKQINTYIEYYDQRAEDEGYPDQWIKLYEILAEDVNETIPANTQNYEIRNIGGEIQWSLINAPDYANVFRIGVDAYNNPEISGWNTTFYRDGQIYG